MRYAVILLLLAAVAVAAPVPKALKKQPDAEALAGRWDVVCEHNGQPSSTGIWTFDPERKVLAVGNGATVGAEYHIKIDPTKAPKQIDVGTFKGIYEIDGDDIRIAFTTSGDRPTDFTATAGVFDNHLVRLPKQDK